MIEKLGEHVSNLLNDDKKRHEGYAYTVKEAEAMAHHTKGTKPKDLLEIYRPHESEEVRNYRLKTYKPVTKSSSEKVINQVNKILNPRYFTVEFPPEAPAGYEETLGKFFTENYGVYGSIWTWLRETFIIEDFTDANALVCIKPEPTEDDTQTFKPLPYIYGSQEVLDYVLGEYYIIFKGEFSNGHFNDNKGRVIYIDKEVYNTYYYQGGELTEIELLTHNFNETPVFFTGGEVYSHDEKVYYKSFINGVRPHWDKVIELSSDKDGTVVNHLYLERWEVQVDCEAKGCEGGYIDANKLDLGFTVPGDKAYRVKCPNCHGTGKVTNRGPYGAMTVNLDAFSDSTGALGPVPPAGYIDRNIEPLDRLIDIIKDEIKAGFAAINLEVLNNVGENQSGIAKAIDRSDAESFLLRVSSHVFDYVLPNVIYYTALWMYGTQRSKEEIKEYLSDVVISKSKEFNIITVSSLVEELGQAQESGATSLFKNIERQIVNTRFANNEKERVKNLAIINLKPFPGVSEDDLLTRSARGSVREKDLILNDNLEWLVDMAVEIDEDFLAQSKSEQLNVLYNLIDQEFQQPALIPTEDGALVAGEEIPGEEIPQDIDAEAEAKARLKGSVGGVQGILEIQKAVAEGTSSRSSAKAVLQEIYGFESETANRLLS